MSSVAARHADWLSLVEPDGPFVTLPVLRRVFADGLDRAESATREEMRSRLAVTDLTDATAARDWCTWVLEELLEWGPYLRKKDLPSELQLIVAEHGTVLRPEFALTDAEEPDTKWRVLVEQYPYRTPLASRMPGDRWAATPVERMALLCRSAGVPVGLVTDGDQWVLVWAPKDAAVGHATFTASLFSEEPTLLDAFVSLLGAKRFFAVAAADTIEAMLAESANAQAEVTDQLGRQVRAAVELLVGAISRANLERDGELLVGIEPRVIYEASLTVMMRLVFLLSAEERGLLPLDDDTYQRFYAVASMREELQAEADLFGEEPLERRSAAWHRMLAQFRAVYGGISHESLRIPAYGGRLFDPDRFPFLEGRTDDEPWRTVIAHPLPVDDLTVLAILNALQVLEFRQAGVTEARRLTYRTLDVEQIGHVYEGLLDHSAVAAEGLAVGLVGSQKGLEPEIALADLEAADARGQLAEWLAEVSGKTSKQVDALLGREVTSDDRRLLAAAVDNDEALLDRIEPYVHFMRRDLRGLPMVFPAGALYVTETGSRRDSGTAYTTRELAEEVARYALEPLVYSPGPADGADRSEWKLKTSIEILELKVCDPAVGSGAILVAACRYLGERLAEAWVNEGELESSSSDPDDLFLTACRAIADRCLYAVDRDPLAVEMAKLSLWLVTMAKERPFTFLDHSIRCGDSLLGITEIEQIRRFHMDPAEGSRIHRTLFDYTGVLAPLLNDLIETRRRLAAIRVVSLRDVEEKQYLTTRAEDRAELLELLGDLIVGAALNEQRKVGSVPLNGQLLALAAEVGDLISRAPGLRETNEFVNLKRRAQTMVDIDRPSAAPVRHCLHWPLAFPEVFLADGKDQFDAVIGNPPFLGGKRVSGRTGHAYREFAMRWLSGARGNVDLVAFFFQRASQIGSSLGFIATNSVAQGDTRQAGLRDIVSRGWRIHRALTALPWPGAASVVVAVIWMARDWNGPACLDGDDLQEIDSSLSPAGRVQGEPYSLADHAGQSFQGSILVGRGFVLDEEEAKRILGSDPVYRDVVKPYLGGADLNQRPDHKATRWAIDFFNRSEEEARRYHLCWEIVNERVRPERQRLKPDGTFALRAPQPQRYWQYADKRPALYRLLEGKESTVVIAQVSNTLIPLKVAAQQILDAKLIVFPTATDGMWGVLTSVFHQIWVIRWTTTLGTGITYVPTRVFDTYPFPIDDTAVGSCIRELDKHRSGLMLARNEGLTKLYNRVHDPAESDAGIARLREMHVKLDSAVAASYGWEDLHLGHGFHETRQGVVRFTAASKAQTELLDRLLELNHRRNADELVSGAHGGDRAAPSRKRARRAPADQPSLLGDTGA